MSEPRIPGTLLDGARYPSTLSNPRANAKTIAFLETIAVDIIAEIGVYRGQTTEHFARYLDGRGTLHLFDFADVVERVRQQLEAIGYTNVVAHGNSYKLLDSYNWSLMKVLQEHREPIFEYVFLDGAHVWAHDALAFLLVDRLLKPGGYVDFDNFAWTLAASASLRPERFPLTAELYTEEQMQARQVSLVMDLLVRRDSRYREIVRAKVFQKVS